MSTPEPPKSGQPENTQERFAALSPKERELLLKVADILERLQFGTILLVVQDGKVVQIEMAEKIRLR